MPDSTISALPSATPLTPADLVPCVQAGVTKTFSIQQFIAANGAASMQVADYASVRAITANVTSVYVTGYLGTSVPSSLSGLFVRDDTDSTSADDGGCILVASGGKRWKRVFSGPVDIRWFGALGDGITDDAPAIQAALTYASASNHTRRVHIPNGLTGTYKIGSQLLVSGGVTVEWGNSNTTLKKYFNGDMFFVQAGLTHFINPGIDGNGASYTGGGIRYADGTHFTFDGVIENMRIANTADSGIIFNGPRGGSGIRVTGGSVSPYNPGGSSSAGPAGIRMSGGADTDATPRIFTDVEASSAPLIDLTGMVTTFVKGGQCGTILFGGNPDVNFVAAGTTFLSAKASIEGVRVRDGLWIRGQDHSFSGCISHGYAPQYSGYGILGTPLTVGWQFNTDAQNCTADSSNVVINKITDLAVGLGDSVNKFYVVDMGYNFQWLGSSTNPAIGNGQVSAVYNVSGAMVDVSIFIQMGSTTTFGSGFWEFTLPYQVSSASFRGAGNARSHNSGVADELGMCFINSVGNPSNFTAASVANGNNFSSAVPHTWKSTDYLELNFRYLRG